MKSEVRYRTQRASGPKVNRNLSWYVKRLRVMGLAEVVYRVEEQCTLKLLEAQHQTNRASRRDWAADIGRFSFCAGTERRLPVLPWSLTIDDETIERLLRGQLYVLGHQWVWRGQPSVWHEAPDTRREWPQLFFGRIPYREGNPYGDVRIAWEPSRLQHLITLALLAESGGPELRRRAVAQLETQLLSWVEANPFLTGIHYISVMECGLRILALCYAIDLVREWLQTPQQVWKSLLSLVEAHARLIQKRVSIHSSAGNHTIAEAAALVYAGSLFPEMGEALGWRSLGLSLLEKEASRQILADGGSSEQSFWYLRFVSDLYGLVASLVRHQRGDMPSAIEDAFLRSQSFLKQVRVNHVVLPCIGDGDSGYALSPFLDFSGASVEEQSGHTTFKDSGYSVIRTGSGNQRQQLIFDHGPLGMTPCNAHGHGDALAVLLHMGRYDVLLDPGTYTYTGHPLWRRYFRGTQAHNTVTVDSLDQAVQETAFMWSHPFRAHIVFQERSSEGDVTMLAYHDGYKERVGVTHWRAVLFDPPNTWLIWDRLTGKGAHELELNWHLGIEPKVGEDRYVLPCDGDFLYIAVDGGVSTLHRGETEPISGWRSLQYGLKEPIPTLRTVFMGTLPHEFLTRIWKGAGQAPPKPSLGKLLALRRLTHEDEAH